MRGEGDSPGHIRLGRGPVAGAASGRGDVRRHQPEQQDASHAGSAGVRGGLHAAPLRKSCVAGHKPLARRGCSSLEAGCSATHDSSEGKVRQGHRRSARRGGAARGRGRARRQPAGVRSARSTWGCARGRRGATAAPSRERQAGPTGSCKGGLWRRQWSRRRALGKTIRRLPRTGLSASTTARRVERQRRVWAQQVALRPSSFWGIGSDASCAMPSRAWWFSSLSMTALHARMLLQVQSTHLSAWSGVKSSL
mmetsp:Transcript_82350/g.218508  ORF Transcript_82350/g.218508 Transcript_82350/m.218508 type:complete len:252 (-) Transcript_82350:107-862(-)